MKRQRLATVSIESMGGGSTTIWVSVDQSGKVSVRTEQRSMPRSAIGVVVKTPSYVTVRARSHRIEQIARAIAKRRQARRRA